MKLEEIEKRMSEINQEVEVDGADLDALEIEVGELTERKKEIKQKVEKRKAKINEVVNADNVTVIKTFKEERNMGDKVNGVESKEYRNAYLKNLVGGDMSVEERAAFTHTTANTTAPIPTTMLNEIWDLVSKQHVIMGDIKTYKTGTVLEVIKHTEVLAGKAKTVAEGVANDDEKNTFVKVTLSGKDFSKHVEISYAMGAMSIDALENYLTNEIAGQISEALADDTIAQIKTDTAAGNKINTAKVKELGYADLTGAFAKLKKVKERVVYVNNATFYTNIVSMVDTTGRPLFQPNMQEGAMGVLLGAKVKIEESVADNEIFVGDPQMVVCNMVQDILIERDRDVKRHVDIYAGYARGESALLNDTSFVVLTVKQA